MFREKEPEPTMFTERKPESARRDTVADDTFTERDIRRDYSSKSGSKLEIPAVLRK